MNIVIVEDEIYTAKSLVKSIKELVEEANIVKIIDSVEEAIEFFSLPVDIDLIFMDIQLSDGISFDIFKSVEIESPIIFTTSYNEYAIKAFEVNSIDYLLKPIEPKMLEKSLNKFRKQFNNQKVNQNFDAMLSFISKKAIEYKDRFLVKTSSGLQTIFTTDIAYFFIENHIVYIKNKDGKHYAIENNLDTIEKLVDPKFFFRLNRQCIAHIKSIKKIHNFFNNTLKIELEPSLNLEIIVSRYNIKEFKQWLDK